MQKGLLQPLPNPNPPNPKTSDYNPNKHCKFHQHLKHSTNNCIHLKHEIQNLIDSGKIADPEKPATMMIISGVSEEEILNSFEDLNL